MWESERPTIGDNKEARNLDSATHRDVGHQLQSYEGGSRSCQKDGLLVVVSAKHCSSCSLRRWLGPLS